MDKTTLYKQEILEHYKHPMHYGKLEACTHACKLANTTCGDEIEMTLQFSKEGVLDDVKFEGSGCAISIASASMLTKKIEGKSLEEIRKITATEILESLGMEKESGRIKCALLGWEVLRKAIS
jgi:nitrogen fixation NifU-like protein